LKISTAGGMNPEWSRDGKELYFLSPDYRLMAVTVTFSGETVSLSKPTVLFRLPGGSEYGVSSDRNRFLVYAPTGEANPIIVLSNWAKKN
jgi:hypothetical protein